MADLTLDDLLDYTQELLGLPVGDFYNRRTRIRQLNQAQRKMNLETEALTSSDSIAVTSGTRDYNVPADFQTFAMESPTFVDTSNLRYSLQVVSAADLDQMFPGWQDSTSSHKGTPAYLLLRNGQLTLYPEPNKNGTLELPYIVLPTDMAADSDVPFNGVSRLNQFADGLAYHACFVATVGRAPQLAVNFKQLYDEQERLMRHFVRTNPQHFNNIRPD